MSEPEKRFSSFSLTCNRLSHYMKEKATQPHHPPINGAMIPMKYMVSTHDHHPSFMPAREEKAQLTIFYEGKVMVFHDFPAGKAHELMQIASKESLTTPKPSLHSPASDLPIIRRASLYRFLEKRKERMVSKAPYELERSSSSAVPKVGQGASTQALGAADEEPHINGPAQAYTVSSSSES